MRYNSTIPSITKGVNMNVKKVAAAAVLMVLTSASLFAAQDTGMQDTQDYIVGGAGILGLILVIIINLFWIAFPIGGGYMTYSYFKRQSLNSQEENGLKMIVTVFIVAVVGFLAAYFIVGSIGKYAGNKNTLSEGNKYMVSNFIGAVVQNFGDKIRTQ